MDLSDEKIVRSLVARHSLRLSKALGQNFLIDPSVCPRMAALCASPELSILEIGPGVGVLTKELAARAKKVVAVELDRRLKPVLDETLAGCGDIELVWGDILKLDLRALFDEHFAGTRAAVCANLPYYITSPALMRLLESRLPFETITLMLQKETARRVTAPVGSRESGAVTAAIAYYAEPELLFEVGRNSFLPAPNVDSAVIRLNVRKAPPVSVVSEDAFFRVVKAAFSQRRKTVLNSLSAGLGLPKAQVSAALSRADIRESERAERLTLAQFAALADGLTGG